MLIHKGTQRLETQRLLLRRFTMEDVRAMYDNWASDCEVTKFLTWPAHTNLDVTKTVLKSWVDAYQHPHQYQWAIVLKEYEDSPIGSISGMSPEENTLSIEIGYCIGRKWWHQGIMSEALGAVMDYLFDEVGFQRIYARHDPRNPNSGAVMKKCGMHYEGTTRQSDRNNQGICDAVQYALLKSDRQEYRHFMDGFTATDDATLVQEVYRRFDEDSRLTKTQAAQVEFLTSVHYIERYLAPGARILDIGAGAGEYSLYFARNGYAVSALELADSNIQAFRKKMKTDDNVDLVQGNALDLRCYSDNSFDVVLLFGPLYHLHDEKDRLRCIAEAKRVCKPGGKIFFAFISNDIVILTMQQMQKDYLIFGDYNKDTFRLDDMPFVFHTVDWCRKLLRKAAVKILHEVASDGASELLQDMVNDMDEETYRQYLRYHFYICEKPEFLGMSNHLLFIAEK